MQSASCVCASKAKPLLCTLTFLKQFLFHISMHVMHVSYAVCLALIYSPPLFGLPALQLHRQTQNFFPTPSSKSLPTPAYFRFESVNCDQNSEHISTYEISLF
ncbi:UNVERIFIED_CONTAM: hypothetical protein K2H54_022975 [Gekko kuhli]